ncbi:Lrp/AsnC family transcriptional regulator [Glaciimonas immobilis]|nr:Lrp/AsnC family transcriptional regulator [Glaciimonas immobilis]KAF3996375.1 Lrp/AsnC family transcriptional regulator [Glaciimonas immobilis]
MDKIDKQILAILQEDATVAVAEIAEKVNLSSTPCWRRIQKLEEEGYLMRRVALLDPQKLNVGVTVFVSIKTNQHNAAWYAQFSAAVQLIPEVVEFYRMSGHIDYLLRIVVPNIAAYDKVYQKLTQSNALFDVSASFAMEQIKHTTALPLGYIDGSN